MGEWLVVLALLLVVVLVVAVLSAAAQSPAVWVALGGLGLITLFAWIRHDLGKRWYVSAHALEEDKETVIEEIETVVKTKAEAKSEMSRGIEELKRRHPERLVGGHAQERWPSGKKGESLFTTLQRQKRSEENK